MRVKIAAIVLLILSMISFQSYSQLMIFELYAHGGNSGARYQNDFVVIYNSGGSAQSLNGWSLQYASAAGSSWSKHNFSASASIPAGGYFILEATTSGTDGTALPSLSLTPSGSQQLGETSGSFGTGSFGTTGGKIALLSTNNTLSTNTPNTNPEVGSTIVDFLGYGSPSDSENTAATTPTSTRVLYRSNGTDTNNNSTDFARSDFLSNGSFPVQLISFKGVAENTSIKLHWQTASETNSSHFELQKSRNAVNFETIAKIEGKGVSTEEALYESLDNQPFEGDNYYRLKQVDLDGTIDYSKTIHVFYTSDQSFVSLYPNPVMEGTQPEIVKSSNLNLSAVFATNGREVTKDLNKLNSGVYVLRFIDEERKEQISKRLVVH